MTRAPREFPSWILIPLFVVLVGGGFLLYERVKDVQETRLDSTDLAIVALKERAGTLHRMERLQAELQKIPSERRQDVLKDLLSNAIFEGESMWVPKLLPLVGEEGRSGLTSELGFAVQRGDLRMARTLLDAGVPIRAARSGGRGSRSDYSPPLLEAVRTRSIDAARLLISRGADPDETVEMKGWQIREFVAPKPSKPEIARASAVSNAVERTGARGEAKLSEDDAPDRGAVPPQGAPPEKPRSPEALRRDELIQKISLRELARRTGDDLLVRAFRETPPLKIHTAKG